MFRRRRFFQGRPIRGSNIEDIAWLRPDGQPMTERGLEHRVRARARPCSSTARGSRNATSSAERVVDDSFLLLFNAHHQPVLFTLPGEAYGRMWRSSLDTADPLRARARRRERDARPGGRLRITARSLMVLRKTLLTSRRPS